MDDGKPTPPPLPPHEEGENSNTKTLYVNVLKSNIHGISKTPKDTSQQVVSSKITACTTPPSSQAGDKQKLVFGSINYPNVYSGILADTSKDPEASIRQIISLNSTFQGKPAILFPSTAKNLLVERLKFVLVGKYSHGRPSLSAIKLFFVKLKLKGSINISIYDKKHIFLECSCKADFYRIWMGLIWFVEGLEMRVFKWSPDFSPIKESSIAPVWVRIEGLPLYMFAESYLLSIAKAVGNPIRVDPRNINRTILNTAWVCIELDVQETLVEDVWVSFVDEGKKESLDGFWIKFFYDVVPPYCSYCQHIGHIHEICKRKLEQEKSAIGEVTFVKQVEQVGKVGQVDKFRQNEKAEMVEQVQQVVQVGKTEIADKKPKECATGKAAAGESSGVLVSQAVAGEIAAGELLDAAIETKMMGRLYNKEPGFEQVELTENAEPTRCLGDGHNGTLIVQGGLGSGVEVSKKKSLKQTTNTLDEQFTCRQKGQISVVQISQAGVQTSIVAGSLKVLQQEPCVVGMQGMVVKSASNGTAPGCDQAEADLQELSAGNMDAVLQSHRSELGMAEKILQQEVSADSNVAEVSAVQDCSGTKMMGKQMARTVGTRLDTALVQIQQGHTVSEQSNKANQAAKQEVREQRLHSPQDQFLQICEQVGKEVGAAACGVLVEEEAQEQSLGEGIRTVQAAQECFGNVATKSKVGAHSWADSVDKEEKEEEISIISQLSPSEIKDCAKNELAKIYSSPTSPPPIPNRHILDKEGNAVHLSEIIDKSARVSELSHQLTKLRNMDDSLKGEHGMAILMASASYDKYLTWYTIEILRTIKEHRQTTFYKSSATDEGTPLSQKVIKNEPAVTEQEWSTAKRRGKNRNRTK